jgi:hypothetical protein
MGKGPSQKRDAGERERERRKKEGRKEEREGRRKGWRKETYSSLVIPTSQSMNKEGPVWSLKWWLNSLHARV